MSTATDPGEVLRRRWGFPGFRPLQREAVEAVLSGRDALVVMPTGGGKSLCYQVPAACGRGTALVVSPLIALMDDQVAAARAVGLRAAALHSNLAAAEGRQAHAAAVRGELDLVYASPERLLGGGLFRALAGSLALVAVDEAHCVSHWGHDFRTEYRRLGPLFETAPDVPRLALTATATVRVQEDIAAQLGLRDPERLLGHPDRPNLVYRAAPRTDAARQVVEAVRRHPGEGGIVYALTRREVERIAEVLARAGVDARAYHAGLDAATRARVQADFVNERLAVVVATIAFGMGIDRSNVRFVVHAGLPRSIEHYQQESGRAGRDGLSAECLLLASAGDLARHRKLAEAEGPLAPERRAALDAQLAGIGRFAVSPVCRHRVLVEHFGHRIGEEGCGACDVCLGETALLGEEEALAAARAIVSAAAGCGNRFGTLHVLAVLRGARIERVLRRRHERLPSFGALQSAPERTVRAWIDQLVVQGFLEVDDGDGLPLLRATPAGMSLLGDGGRPVRLGRFRGGAEPAGRGTRTPRGGAAASRLTGCELPSEAEGVFQRLRALRRSLAARDGVPPYVVFSDATLREMALAVPRDPAALLAVRGVGEHKLARYGEAFLAALRGESGGDPGS